MKIIQVAGSLVIGVVLGAAAFQSWSVMWRGASHMSTILDTSLSRVDVELAHNRHVVLTDVASLRFLKAAMAMTQVKTLAELGRTAEEGRGVPTSGPCPSEMFFNDGSSFTCRMEAYPEHRGLRVDVLWRDLDCDETVYDVEFSVPAPPPLAKLLDQMVADRG